MPKSGGVGVAIDTADDMADLFDSLPLDELSVNFTINATAPIILAFYLVAAERQQVPYERLSGTLQNDLLKEFLARKAFIFPPTPSMRLVADVVEWSARYLPRFNPISITGYHAREAGCTAVQELGPDHVLRHRLRGGTPWPRARFRLVRTTVLVPLRHHHEPVRGGRQATSGPAPVVRHRHYPLPSPGPTLGRGCVFFSGNSGTTLTAAQPLNNIIRSTIQCLGAVLGGAQSIHVMGYDEAYELPTEEAVTLSLRTQQIVAHESGVADTVDALAGSYYVEWLTAEVENRAREVMAAVEDLGGVVKALEGGTPQRWIAAEAYRRERAIADGTEVRVGVNRYVDDSEIPHEPRLFTLDDEIGGASDRPDETSEGG